MPNSFHRRKDFTGNRFGMLVAKSGSSIMTKFGFQMFWNCVCDCGNKRLVRASEFKDVKSCGCISKSNMNGNISRLSHGDSRHGKVQRLWRIWSGMRTRCRDKKDLKNWRLYGGRGISVCREWEKSYSAFKKWALLNGYESGLSLDRINNDGNYEPSNCRWATQKQQMANRRTYGLIEVFSDDELLCECRKRGLLK